MSLGKLLKNAVRRFIRECWGPTATEYAVLLVLVVFGALAAITLLGSLVSGSTQSTAVALPSGVAGDGSSSGGSGGSESKKQKKPPRRRQRRKRAQAGNINGLPGRQHLYVLAESAEPKVSANSSTSA